MSEDKPAAKTPIYKKWWFWVIIVFVVICAGAGAGSTAVQEITEDQDQSSASEPADGSMGDNDKSTGDGEISEKTQQEQIQEIYSTPQKTVEYFANQRISSMDGADLIKVSVSEYERNEVLVATIDAEFTRGSAESVLNNVLTSYSQRVAESVFNGIGGADTKCEITVKWKMTDPKRADVWYKFNKDGSGLKLSESNY